MALTDTAVRQAKPSERAYTVSDGDGLALFVHPRGDKYWHFRYRASGRAQRVSLGTYPEVSLKEARLRREGSAENGGRGRSWGKIGRVPASAVKQLRKRVRAQGSDVPDYPVPLSSQAVKVVKAIQVFTRQYELLIPGRNELGYSLHHHRHAWPQMWTSQGTPPAAPPHERKRKRPY
ncbi:DUF4102 domain-containing protein [Pseudomonas sp. SST3]|nr:Arm DNA-binding domain-containing protein [Pseudomonas sp. SST3]NKQ10649.1 DUF4102 domain-containing protein [Pseudomonas sp. SST3]